MKKEIRKKFIGEIVWAATKQGGFQRSRIYKPNAQIEDRVKNKFRDTIKSYCFNNLYVKYDGKQISEEELITEIENLIKNINKEFGSILKGGEFRFGNAQKFVNLYLKLLWIVGEIKEPPHFPVDRIIQKNFKIIKSWTNMNKIQYWEVINEAKEKVETKQSLAEWELTEYEKLVNSK